MNILLAHPFSFQALKSFYKDLELYHGDVEEIEKADLIIFPGGEDINPAIYGQSNTHSRFSLRRDALELYVLKYALELNKKLLGICRGHQLINAVLGGSLIQDLSLLNSYHDHSHWLDFDGKDSVIEDYFIRVNSMHHQGVVEPGEGLKITSMHKGIIESCEGKNIITTQFHPEFMQYSENFFNYVANWAKEKGE